MSGGAVQSQIVHPSDSRWESVLLGAVTLLLVLITAGYTLLFGREESADALADWQISAYSDLRGADQAVYNQLLAAVEEIRLIHLYEGTWPDVPAFQEAFLPPFYRDLSWERNGAIAWRRLEAATRNPAGITVYFGNGGSLDGQGAWLLIFDHRHAGNEQISEADIWRHPAAGAEPPVLYDRTTLIRAGWRQVVPYQGRDEVERLNAGRASSLSASITRNIGLS